MLHDLNGVGERIAHAVKLLQVGRILRGFKLLKERMKRLEVLLAFQFPEYLADLTLGLFQFLFACFDLGSQDLDVFKFT